METPAMEEKGICNGPDIYPTMIRLPIAPRINHRIRFSPLKGRKNLLIQPQTALDLVAGMQEMTAAKAVLLYGPGDPLAEIEPTLETGRLLAEKFPDTKVVVRTLGIGGLRHADKMAQAGIDEVEILVDGVLPAILEEIYAWIRPGFKTLKLSEASEILCNEQAQAIQAFKDAGMQVRILTTVYPSANDDHIELLAKKVLELGADSMVLHPYAPEPEADIALPLLDPDTFDTLISAASAILPVHKGRPASIETTREAETQSGLPRPGKARPNVAVVSSNGMEVDLHLGQAPQLLVYGPRDDGLACLLECRPTPDAGSGSDRWALLADRIPDCFALLAASAGERPQRILGQHGIQVVITQENIEGTVDVLYGGGKKKGCGKQPGTS